ncbi:MAG: enoyl-CoA hydratase/isomerase family protein [Alphaproteobacteria bacterium]|nr:enoyl-CoA hydratase/isomerase family protein [Alphaproteobacteria bacterium]
MTKISKIAVIGSGTMGSNIAALIASAGYSVLLFDIASNDKDRSSIAKKAIENILSSPLKPLMDKSLSKNITPANLDDDLKELESVDWVVEAIVENIDIKKNLYAKITQYLSKTAIISSNTSTIPLKDLVKDLDENFATQFVITHFFNPPRYLDLLEFVTLENTKPEVIETIKNFCEITLGKQIVNCKDTPGFIANRIGCYWLEQGLRIAIQENVPIDMADKAVAEYTGIPKTGVFGLWDLIGIDLMPMITKSTVSNLSDSDDYVKISKDKVDIVDKLIAEKRLGRKTKAGFYKIEKSDSGNKTLITDLKTGEYIESSGSKIEKIENLKYIQSLPSNYGRFVWRLTYKMLNYAAGLIPSAAYNIKDIDTAMKEGYGWKYGPFELIDMLSDDKQVGAEWLRIHIEILGEKPALLLKEIGNKKFYNNDTYFDNGNYKPVSQENIITYKKLSTLPPIIESKSAKLVDIGNDILCLMLTNKMGVLDSDAFDVIIKSVSYMDKNPFDGMIIAGDEDNFCAGADVNNFIAYHENKEFDKVAELLKHGQLAMNTIKNSVKPVVCAINGVAFGGGCELALHAKGVQIHANSKVGLVETRIGLIPGWGGCKEMVMKPFRSTNITRPSQEIVNNFNLVFNAINSDSAMEAINLGYLSVNSTQITFNKKRLLEDAKQYAIKLAKNKTLAYPSFVMIDAELINDKVASIVNVANLLPHEKKIMEILLKIFTTKGKSIIKDEEMNDMEVDGFIDLIKTDATYQRMVSLIKNRKVLKN